MAAVGAPVGVIVGADVAGADVVVLRPVVWLLGMRPLLMKALDHLGIENDNGLTDSDEVSKIADLDKGNLKKLVAELKDVANIEDIALYLKFMGAKNVEAAL